MARTLCFLIAHRPAHDTEGMNARQRVPTDRQLPTAIRFFILATLALCAGSPLTARAQAADLQGTYVLIAAQSADIEAAIETSIAQMNFIKRPIARGRLKKTNTAYQRIHIVQLPDAVEITFDQRKPLRMPTHGTAIEWTREDGEVFDVSAQWQGSQLTQTYAAEDGKRVNRFRPGENGTLHLEVEISSEQLPRAVKYTLAYKRAE